MRAINFQAPSDPCNLLTSELLRAASSRVISLTSRQLEVLRLLADGLNNKSIAEHMGISQATAKQFITAILLKLCLESRLQAGLVGFAVLVIGEGQLAELPANVGRRSSADERDTDKSPIAARLALS